MVTANLEQLIETIIEMGGCAVIILPHEGEGYDEEEEKEMEETAYDAFRTAEIFETGAGVDQDAILMDNPLQS